MARDGGDCSGVCPRMSGSIVLLFHLAIDWPKVVANHSHKHPVIIASPSDSWTRACPSGPEASAGAPNRTTRVVESE